MRKHRPGLLSLSLRCGLMLLVLMQFAEAAQAQSSEEYPGPWSEITQDVREFLALHKVYACNEAVGRQSSRNSDEYLLYCTRDEKHWTSWRVQPAARKLRGPDKLIEGIPLPSAYDR
jgi:hypothetical protein